MNKSGFLFLAVVSLFSLFISPFVADVHATSETIFRPVPGRNDGSDNGSANGGKDTYIYGNDSTTNCGAQNVIGGSPRSNCNPAQTKAYIQFDVSSFRPMSSRSSLALPISPIRLIVIPIVTPIFTSTLSVSHGTK